MPAIRDNAEVIFNGSQVFLQRVTTKKIDPCGPGVKIRTQEQIIVLFFP